MWKRCRVLYSRDVLFDESRPGWKVQKEEPFTHRSEFLYDSMNEVSQEFESGEEHSGEVLVNEGVESPPLRRSTRSTRKPLKENDVRSLVELPKDKRVIGSKWVFRRKISEDGKSVKFKARLVAQGFTQKPGEDFDETYSPLVRFESIRVIISLAAQFGWKIHQMDVSTAFLHGHLKEEVYMSQPDGFKIKGKEHLVCRLNCSIYGLQRSPRCWNTALDDKLRLMDFNQCLVIPVCTLVQKENPGYTLQSMLTM